MDSLAPTGPAAAELERPTPTARRLAAASISPNTRRAYSGALRRLDAWLAGRRLEDATLASYLAELHDQGRAPASASTTVAAACFRARLARAPSPAGERTARVLAGYRRTAGDRGRGQTRPFGAADLAAVLATCQRPRRRGRGVESEEVALDRGRLDAVIAGLLFMAGMRRSEVSALHWADVADAADGDGVLVTVRRSKTNQEGETTDVRFVKGGVARAIRTLRAAANPGPADRVAPLSPKMVGLRFSAAARAAGEPVRTVAVAVARTPPKDRRPRPKQWTDAVAVLRRLQGEYGSWRDALPEGLADSRTAELLEEVCEVDLDALDVELPRGFGRD